MPSKQGDPIVETSVEARAGFLDRPVAIVLIVSMLCVIAAFSAVFLGFFANT